MALPMRLSGVGLKYICGTALSSGSVFWGIAGRSARQCVKYRQIQDSLRCVQCGTGQGGYFQRLSGRRSLCSAATDKSILRTDDQSTDALDKVSSEISAAESRLFAVVYIQGLQYKVSTNDIIQIQVRDGPEIGQRIRLEKVMLVGGDNFTLLGRPLLGLDQVRVEATVIEKTISQKHIKFLWVKRSSFKKYKEYSSNYSILRINSIEVSPNLK